MRQDVATSPESAPTFNTMILLSRTAGLDKALKFAWHFTIFAPTDEAFAKLPPGTVDELLKPENKKRLVNLLCHTAAYGKLTSADLSGKDSVKAINGHVIDIARTSDGRVTLDGEATIVQTDIPWGNAVVHTIDTVMVPLW